MPVAGKFGFKGKMADYYEIAVRQFQQQILPSGMPATTVWGYGPTKAPMGPAIFNAPSLTIEAKPRRADGREMDQRPGGREQELFCRTSYRWTRRCTGPTRPAGQADATRVPIIKDSRPPLRTLVQCRW